MYVNTKFIDMQLFRGSLVNAISWRPGNESLALKVVFTAFFSLGLFFILCLRFKLHKIGNFQAAIKFCTIISFTDRTIRI